MDQVHVEAPVASAQAASLEREFYSHFPLVLNYVARLVDDIDRGVGFTCAAFRQVAENLRHRRTGRRLRRVDGFAAPTQCRPEGLKSPCRFPLPGAARQKLPA